MKVGAKLATDFPEYRRSIISYLCRTRATHWEIDVRTSSAKALELISADSECLEILLEHVPALISDAKCENNDFRTHGGVLALGATFRYFIEKSPEKMEEIKEIVSNLIGSRHFSKPDDMSHLIRPSILMLLTEYAKYARRINSGLEEFSNWLTAIQTSVLKMGTMIQSRKFQMLKGLCLQVRVNFYALQN